MTLKELERAKEFIIFCKEQRVSVAKSGDLEFSFSFDAYVDNKTEEIESEEPVAGNDIDGVDDEALYYSTK